jgi:guanylate kinase
MTGLPPQAPPVVLSAPSGAGKTTIARALVRGEEDFAFSVSVTTRTRRRGEEDGRDYWFVSDSEFRTMAARGDLAEWAVVHGELYGTPKEGLVRAAEAGRHVILDIDVQGARQIREAVPEALLLFILPPSVEELFRRLSGRGTESEETLRRRLNTALGELTAADDFDFFVINDDLEQAIGEVRAIARTGRPPPGGCSGTLEDARRLRKAVEALLRQDRLL